MFHTIIFNHRISRVFRERRNDQKKVYSKEIGGIRTAQFKVQQVSKVYEGISPVVTLKNINLQFEDCEFICILGPSGCGKSTLLELLAGLQKPTSGHIFIDSEEVIGPNEKLGVVFQDASLYPWRTIFQNVGIGLEFAGYKRAATKLNVEKYLKLVGLDQFAENYPHQLSGGMRQRAGIARALVSSPEVLLMDEPFGAVDHSTRLKLQDDLLEIWEKEKKTVIFVTHDVSEAVYLADRVVLLSARPGEVLEIFKITVPRPRRRNDLLLLNAQNKIYSAIYQVSSEENLEYNI
ncbi:NitT/TauT family transport system ATP-binding protein [Neobacillus niacini]|uniref:ABC transporter ATP-binding protein n=1 Tax=Neobacillus niacini TaxID=86668 RepID=UPI0028598B65|nr:ABC transporter ATP-binding protein [Neobacillus niacini]MDR7080276.1 NitT/TauT family transport system ATP-binding protein [Neobacillus niacini]